VIFPSERAWSMIGPATLGACLAIARAMSPRTPAVAALGAPRPAQAGERPSPGDEFALVVVLAVAAVPVAEGHGRQRAAPGHERRVMPSGGARRRVQVV
jgi:hypothetical protein